MATFISQLVINLKQQGLIALNDQRSVGHPSILSSAAPGDESVGMALG